MLKISNLRVPPSVGDKGLKSFIAETLGIPAEAIFSLTILRRSVDARRKGSVSFVYTAAFSADCEDDLLKSRADLLSPHVPGEKYVFPYRDLVSDIPPVVVGMGPAGLFAALCLAEAGLRPVVLERGRPVEERAADVERFWLEGALDCESNVQFGEGGAGAFSDGKLTTGIGDIRTGYVLSRLVEFGAPADILYLAKPHIGTDRLRGVLKAVRERLLCLGCDIRFGHRLDDLRFENGALAGAVVVGPTGRYELGVRRMVLAPGHSARDTFEMLLRCGVKLSPKNFSVGVRIEHRQEDIDLAQYGQNAAANLLPPSDYKLAVHLGGRSVYTFCVCPGGRVIAASSGPGQVVTNGMSEYSRGGRNINSALLVTVSPHDFGASPLDGVRFQLGLERGAFALGGGGYVAPAQLVGDFLSRRPSRRFYSVEPTYLPGVRWCSLWEALPEFVCRALEAAIPLMDRKIRGFARRDAVLTAVESRSSSPVRIDRAGFKAVGLSGLFPCGEGAGYAGGIMSAAVDGIRAAEALCAEIAESSAK